MLRFTTDSALRKCGAAELKIFIRGGSQARARSRLLLEPHLIPGGADSPYIQLLILSQTRVNVRLPVASTQDAREHVRDADDGWLATTGEGISGKGGGVGGAKT